MRCSTSRELADYWNALRRGHTIPYARDFDATVAPRALRRGFTLSVRDGAAMMSEVGEGLYELFGVDLRGRPFLSMWSAAAAPEAQALARAALEGSGIVAGVRSRVAGDGVALELLLLPLLRVERRSSVLVIGALAPRSEIASGLSPLEEIRSHRVLGEQTYGASFGRADAASGWSSSFRRFAQRAERELGARTNESTPPYVTARHPEIAARVGGLAVIEGGRPTNA